MGYEQRALIVSVWNKAQVDPRYDASRYRKDAYGWFIAFEEYGQTSDYGWEIDHITPSSKGGVRSSVQPAAASLEK